MTDKTQMLTMLKEEFKTWETLLANLGEAQIMTPLQPGEMSIKDTMAHLMTWQQLSIARLEAGLRGSEPVLPDWPENLDAEPDGEPHDMNPWIYETHQDESWATVYQAWRTGFLRFLELGEAIPERDLMEVDKYPWLEGYALFAVLEGSYGHHQEHYETVSTWLQGTSD